MDHCCIEILDYGWNDQPEEQHLCLPWTKSKFLYRFESVRLSLLPTISEHGKYRFSSPRSTKNSDDAVIRLFKNFIICLTLVLIVSYSLLIRNKLL